MNYVYCWGKINSVCKDKLIKGIKLMIFFNKILYYYYEDELIL